MLGLRRIDHVGLRVGDLDEAAPRWCVQFGFTESHRENGRAFLRCGYEPYSLELIEDAEPGFDHQAFELARGLTLDEVAAPLERSGVAYEPHDDGLHLADPEGNEFCVIGPGSSFLAGCGPLGELACDGTRDVGLFWSGALGWPLVWDRDGETAIQSPEGGTKVAWGGPPVAAHRPGRRQRLTLVTDGEDPEAATEELVDLGARRLPRGAGGAVLLLDPDENEFRVVRRR